MNQLALDLQPAEPEYRTIPLSKGQFAIVDAIDFDMLMQWTWHANWNQCTQSFYAVHATRTKEGKQGRIWMAHLVLAPLPGMIVDHKNHDTLNNRRGNLRHASFSQNVVNSRTRRDNVSGLKGSHFIKRTGRWQSSIRVGGILKHLGDFDNPQSAHDAYCRAVNDLHGEFAFTQCRKDLTPQIVPVHAL